MCGIAGYIDFRGDLFDGEQRHRFTAEALKLIARRGPDAHGVASFEHGQARIQFVHTRLSIIDLSDEANQPFHSEDGRYSLLFNGEIYNYVELREQLKPHRPFRTNSDTEVLLHMFIQYGTDAFAMLEGMFAGAIFDSHSGEVHLFRDHFGIKPFYFYQNSCGIVFASEPKVIRSCIPITNQVNLRQSSTFMLFGLSDYCQETFFNGIDQLRPGQRKEVNLNRGNIRNVTYYDPRCPNGNSELNSPQDYREVIMGAVRRQLRSDVQVGTSLSGGIDSGIIAACTGKILGEQARDVKAISYVAPGFDFDESEQAKQIATKAGLSWIPVQFEIENFEQDFHELVSYMEEPFGSLSMLAQNYIMKAAKAEGCKVMLDGQGGDELYLGYPRLAQRIILENLRDFKPISAITEWFWAVRRQQMKAYYPIISNVYFNSYRFVRMRKYSYFSRYVDRSIMENHDVDAVRDFFSPKRLHEKQVDELHRFILPRLLRYADRNSMFHSIESRVPHLAQNNVGFALNLPNQSKVVRGWTKHIMRKAFESELPDSVTWQTKKIGFDTPQGVWLEKIKPYLMEMVDGCGGMFHKENILADLGDSGKAQDQGLFRVLSTILAIKTGSLSV